MNRILIAPVREYSCVPDFGTAFTAHMASKHNPAVRAESLTAWHALADTIGAPLPNAAFEANGKPFFTAGGPEFAIAHSCKLAAVIIAGAPCGVDIERIRPEAADKLSSRCLLPNERGMDFFEAWTLKESIGKMTGEGIRPLQIDTTKYAELKRYTREFTYEGERYRLSAVSKDLSEFTIECANQALADVFSS